MKERTIQVLLRNVTDSKILFKRVQRRIINKLSSGEELTENEKRYLRGKLGEKLDAIDRLLDYNEDPAHDGVPFLEAVDNYYITGYEALQNNGFGWFYDTRNVVIINTRIRGNITYQGKRYMFIRVKSLRGRTFRKDETTGMKYATNEQIYRDAKRFGDAALLRTWNDMLHKYGKMFVQNPNDFNENKTGGKVNESVNDYGV